MGVLAELDPIILIACALVLTAGGFVKGVTGFAMPMVVVPLLSSIVDVRFGLASMVLSIVVTNIWQGIRGGYFWWAAKHFWPVAAGLGAGIWIGANIAVAIDKNTSFLVLGGVVLFFSAISHFKPDLHLPERFEKPVGALAGLTGGISGGLTSIWGPPMLMFLVARRLEKDAFIGAVGMIYFCGSLFLTFSFAKVEILAEDNVAMSALAVLPVLAGMQVGMWLRDRINQETFRRAVLFTLLLVGLNLIRRGFF
jgi:uncharacterized protein